MIMVRQSVWIFRLSQVGRGLILACRVREMSAMLCPIPERRVIFDGIYRPEPLDTHERLIRAFPVAGQVIEPTNYHTGARNHKSSTVKLTNCCETYRLFQRSYQ